MWTEINGEKKKIACGPCIRGHRSSKCDHKDRVLVEVRKPGRPLSSCPHPSGSCSCERVVINYTIPKTSECACPSDRPVLSSTTSISTGTGNRVQKPRQRKSISTVNPASIEKAIKASQTPDLDATSQFSKTPNTSSLASSERSNEGSPSSSTSSTPRVNPVSPRRESYDSDAKALEATSADKYTIDQAHPQYMKENQAVVAKSKGAQVVSSCCKPKLTRPETEPVPKQANGGCCGNKNKEPLPPKKSCCSGPTHNVQLNTLANAGNSQDPFQNFGTYASFATNGQFQVAPAISGHGYTASVGQPLPYTQSHLQHMPGNTKMSSEYEFNSSLYGPPSIYQQPPAMSMTPSRHNSAAPNGHGGDHNCQCGDNCSCFGCAAHPHNETMTQYIRMMEQYMRTGDFGTSSAPTYDLPAYPHQPMYGAQSSHNVDFGHTLQAVDYSNLPTGTSSYQVDSNAPMAISNRRNSQTAWASGAIRSPDHSTPTNVFDHFNWGTNSRAQQVPTYKREDSASSPSEDRDNEDTPTLSPSSFFWNEITLPGCNDATGTCQCGDGCECVGCLTHGGHNGIPLDQPVTQQNDFSNFLPNHNVDTSDLNTSHYLTNSFAGGST